MSDFLLRTERLILRPFSYEDVQFMFDLNSDPEVVRYTGNLSFKNIAEAKDLITNLIQQFTEKKMGRFVVTEVKSGERLGWCGLKWHESEQIVDLGYRFFRRHWGKGFASEASRVCLVYGFRELCLKKIAAHAMLENAASVRVLEKLNFKRTGPVNANGLNAEGFLLLRQDYE
jgi:RimJ/RimL family protein N-acetyltransferase